MARCLAQHARRRYRAPRPASEGLAALELRASRARCRHRGRAPRRGAKRNSPRRASSSVRHLHLQPRGGFVAGRWRVRTRARTRARSRLEGGIRRAHGAEKALQVVQGTAAGCNRNGACAAPAISTERACGSARASLREATAADDAVALARPSPGPVRAPAAARARRSPSRSRARPRGERLGTGLCPCARSAARQLRQHAHRGARRGSRAPAAGRKSSLHRALGLRRAGGAHSRASSGRGRTAAPAGGSEELRRRGDERQALDRRAGTRRGEIERELARRATSRAVRSAR